MFRNRFTGERGRDGWPVTSAAPWIYTHYLKVALRRAAREKVYSAISLFGLVVGLASFIVIMIHVYHELSYDRFHPDADRIYRVVYEQTGEGYVRQRVATPGALRDAMLTEIPQIEAATHFLPSYWGKALLANERYTYYDSQLFYVDPSFLDLFPFPFLLGDAQSALADPASVVLTQSVATRFFGDEDPLGQTLRFRHGIALTVTGVIEDVPAESHLQFDFLTSIAAANRAHWETSWGEGQIHTYFKVRSGADLADVEARIQQLIDTHHRDYMDQKGAWETFSAQPLTGLNGIYLSLPGNSLYVRVLLSVAFMVLVIAGINYVNLATARSATRAKEIGVRKVVGARRKSLIQQFLVESMLAVLVAGVVAAGLAEAALPVFNDLMQKDLSLFAVSSQPVWGLIAVSVGVLGISAGLYPALYLSAFRPVSVLKKRGGSRSVMGLRRGLVVTQFALSAFLVVGVVVVREQMAYVQTTRLGFEKDQMIVIENFSKTPNRDRDYTVRRAIEAIPGVICIGGTIENIVGLRGKATGSMRLDAHSEPVASLAHIVSEDYLEVLGLEFIEGGNFTRTTFSDLSKVILDFSKVILNETAVKRLGIKGSAVGRRIGKNQDRTVIGVVKDFHAGSLHHDILPYAFFYSPDARHAVVKVAAADVEGTLSRIQETWKTFVPSVPMAFYFLDEAIDRQYRAERNFSLLFSLMTSLALVTAGLGLFGLVAYTAEQRRREIGIRKTLGASVSNVVSLLYGDFLRLVALANIIAWPAAYYAMCQWLDSFAYRIDIGIATFLLAGLAASLIPVLTVSYQATKAATTNPVDSLRYE